MNALKPNSFYPAKSLTGIINEVLNKNFYDFEGGDFPNTIPSVNISETNESVNLEVAAPGLQKNDFNILVEKDQLVISASKEKTQEQTEDGKWTRKEFNFSTFRRSFHLAETIDTEKIHAEYQNGILTVMLPKKEEAKVKAPKVIEIR
jgi:HSP20 family protein